jgi:hypothetical protein
MHFLDKYDFAASTAATSQPGPVSSSSLLQDFSASAGPSSNDNPVASSAQYSMTELQAAFEAALSRPGQHLGPLDAVSAKRLQQLSRQLGPDDTPYLLAALLMEKAHVRQQKNIALSPGGLGFAAGDSSMLQEHLLSSTEVWHSVASSLNNRSERRDLVAAIKAAALPADEIDADEIDADTGAARVILAAQSSAVAVCAGYVFTNGKVSNNQLEKAAHDVGFLVKAAVLTYMLLQHRGLALFLQPSAATGLSTPAQDDLSSVPTPNLLRSHLPAAPQDTMTRPMTLGLPAALGTTSMATAILQQAPAVPAMTAAGRSSSSRTADACAKGGNLQPFKGSLASSHFMPGQLLTSSQQLFKPLREPASADISGTAAGLLGRGSMQPGAAASLRQDSPAAAALQLLVPSRQA